MALGRRRVPAQRAHTGRPLLVTGAIRSGTTWVGSVLAACDGLAVLYEPWNVSRRYGMCAYPWEHQYTYVGPHNEAEVAPAVADALAFRYRPLAHLRHATSLRNAAGLLRDYPVWLVRQHVTHPRPIVKDPIALFSAEWLAERFGSDVVVLVRHPGAFVHSYLRIHETNRFADLAAQPQLMAGPLTPFADEVRAMAATQGDPVGEAVLLWRVVHHVIADLQDRHPDWYVVQHEHLSLDPETEFARMYEHLGLPFDDHVRDEVRRTTGGGNPVDAPEGVRHQLLRDSKANVSSWHRRLSAADRARVHAATARESARWYAADTWPAADPTGGATGAVDGPSAASAV